MPDQGSPEWIKAEQAALIKKNKSPTPWLIMLGAIVLIIVVGVAVNSTQSNNSSNPTVDDKYVQTGESSYSDTTCDDWNSAMSPHQQFAASADMLAGARNKGSGGTGLPPDSLIEIFSEGITNACVDPAMSLTDVAVGLYLTEPRFNP